MSEENKRDILSEEELGKILRRGIRDKEVVVINNKIVTLDQDICFPYAYLTTLNYTKFLTAIFINCEVHVKGTIFLNGAYAKINLIRCDVYRDCDTCDSLGFFHWYYTDCTIHFKAYKTTDHFTNSCIFDPPFPLACPEEGEFIGYKAVKEIFEEDTGIMYPCKWKYRILELLIPADAKRSSALTNKCRCSKALPIELYDLDGNVIETNNRLEASYKSFSSTHFVYSLGRMAYPDSWDENRYNECSHGIHFFMSFKEAVEYCS